MITAYWGKLTRGLPLVAWVVLVSPAAAQTSPGVDLPQNLEPGALREQLERQQEERVREEERRKEREDEPSVIAPERPGDGIEGADVEFFLNAVRFSESEFLSDATLQELANDYVGREVTFDDLNALVERINEIYDERGLITARALIPQQHIEGGEVRILLVEGRLGEVELQGNDYTRADYIRERLRLPTGEVIALPELRGDLDYFNATNDIRVQAALEPGDEFGESDINLIVDEPPRLQVQAFIDNNGVESTGEEQLGVVGIWNGPLRRGDQATAYIVGSEGALTGSLGYALPINRHGGTLEVNLAANDIEIVEGPFKDLDIEGESFTANLGYTHPLLRTGDWILDGFGRLTHTDSETEIEDGLTLTDTEVQKLTLGLGATRLGVNYRWSLQPEIAVVQSDDRGETGRDQDLTLFRLLGSYLHNLSPRFFTVFSASGQYTSEDVTPSTELFQAGGVNTVRGYDQSLISGASGVQASAELHYRWREQLSPFVFVDHATVYPDDPDDISITGTGLGINWRWGDHLRGELIGGYAFDDVTPDQDDYRVHARIVVLWPGQ